MAILHGSWLVQNQGCLFIWGEIGASRDPESPCLADACPSLAMPPTDLGVVACAKSSIAKSLPLFAHAPTSWTHA